MRGAVFSCGTSRSERGKPVTGVGDLGAVEVETPQIGQPLTMVQFPRRRRPQAVCQHARRSSRQTA